MDTEPHDTKRREEATKQALNNWASSKTGLEREGYSKPMTLKLQLQKPFRIQMLPLKTKRRTHCRWGSSLGYPSIHSPLLHFHSFSQGMPRKYHWGFLKFSWHSVTIPPLAPLASLLVDLPCSHARQADASSLLLLGIGKHPLK